MARLADHPSVKHFRDIEAAGLVPAAPKVLDAAWLREICLDAGADDVGFVASKARTSSRISGKFSTPFRRRKA